jgi:hypothetical protein
MPGVFVKRLVRALLLAGLLLIPSPAPAAETLRELLPDLAMAPLRDFRLEATADGRRLLRFTAEIVNLGAGPFELYASRASTSDELMTDIRQRVYREDGTRREVATPAVMHFAGDGHDHWHVRELEDYALTPLGGEQPAAGAKQGFCFSDNRLYQASRTGAPQRAQYRSCGGPNNLSLTMGLSIGWGDIYGWYMHGQYVDVTGLAPGFYELSAVADENGWFEELDEGNNSTSTLVWLDAAAGTVHGQWQYLPLLGGT